MGSMASHPSAGSSKESKTKGTEEQLADIENTLKLLVDALAIKPSAGGNFRSRTPSPSTAIAQGGRSLSPVRSLQGNEEDLVFDTARSHHEGIVPRCKQTLSSEDEASGEQNGEGSKGEPQGILWMTEEVDSRIPGLNPSDTNKANDQNSFILVDTDEWSLDQTEENTNISSMLLFPEEGKGIQKAHRDGMSVEELETLLWPEPTKLQLVQGDSMGIHTEIQESKSEITDFWWDSMGPTELGLGDEKESPENCEEYIDFMYDSLFGTSPLNKEIPSTLHEDEEWIDKTFKEMQIQQYAAWNPFMSLEGEMISVQYDRTTGDFPIGQINPPSSLRVPITLQDRSIKAVIDAAAMVTVISDQIYNEIKPNPPCLKATTLQTAGRNVKMVGRIIGPVSIKLGNVIFPTLVHVAPINNDMLLGLDFLLRIGAGINLKEQHLVVTGATEIVPLEIEYENRASHTISKITADEAEQSPAIIYNLQERSCHNLHPDEIYLPHTSYERPQKDTYCRERLDYPYLFNNQEVFGHADQGMVVSPVTMLKGISVLSTTGQTNQLETETKRRPELNCCICYRQEIALMTILKCIQGEQDDDKQADVIDAFGAASGCLGDVLGAGSVCFESVVGQVYPSGLQLNKAGASGAGAAFLDLHMSVSGDIVSTGVCDKRDDFGFGIVGFPFFDGDVPRSASYGVCVSQLVRFARASGCVAGFSACSGLLTQKLLKQGCRCHKLRRAFSKFYRRCYDLISKFQVGLGSLLRQGLSEPGFYSDLVCGLKRIVGSSGFSAQFIGVISHYGRIGYDIDGGWPGHGWRLCFPL